MITAILALGWVLLAVTAVVLWRLPLAHKPREQPHPTQPRVEPKPHPNPHPTGGDDVEAIVKAVTEPHNVFSVVRTHTGALRATDVHLTIAEARAVGHQLIAAADDALYEQVGICQAETFANGELS